jgi:hypothetical protein
MFVIRKVCPQGDRFPACRSIFKLFHHLKKMGGETVVAGMHDDPWIAVHE